MLWLIYLTQYCEHMIHVNLAYQSKCCLKVNITTNNESEYIAALKGLVGLNHFLLENPEGYVSYDVDVTLFSDSELLVKQMNGEYQVRNERIMKLNEELNDVVENLFESVKFMHIKRGMNSMADRLANDAIDDHFRTHSMYWEAI